VIGVGLVSAITEKGVKVAIAARVIEFIQDLIFFNMLIDLYELGV
jgi:hypothetical protein